MLIPYATLALGAGFLLDLLVGDPQGWPHMVRWMGKLIAGLEALLYDRLPKAVGGAILVVVTLLVCGGLPLVVLTVAYGISPWLFVGIETLLCWQTLATKSLKTESEKVFTALEKGDLPQARRAVSMIVGRDTDRLDEAGVTRAAVETVAENTCDGVVAPLFYLMLGGGPLGCLYKGVNTMDSMIGYRNDRYQQFGRCAARLDDGFNFIPARLSALLMIVAACLCGLDGKGAWRIWRRDRFNHASPNAAQTEAVMAGALGVRLAGNAYYFGKLYEKPSIGEDLRPIVPSDIFQAHRLLYGTAFLMLLLAILTRGAVWYGTF